MNNNFKIYLVEDDVNFGTVLHSYLQICGFEVTWVDDGRRAIDEYQAGGYDICVLDVMLPNADGFEVARRIREVDNLTPFIFLTARAMKDDVIQGFRLGADDYITKPFDSEVLLYKIKAIVRRRRELRQGIDKPLPLGGYVYDPAERLLSINGVSERLSPKEGKLLFLLAKNANQVVTREIALREIWGGASYFTARSMDVYVSKLRKLLRDDPRVLIENIHGSGYRLTIGGDGATD